MLKVLKEQTQELSKKMNDISSIRIIVFDQSCHERVFLNRIRHKISFCNKIVTNLTSLNKFITK
jgi:hypothetical protein